MAFVITLLVCHVIQWLSLKLGGYSGHKKSVDFLNFSLMNCLYLAANRMSYSNSYDLPTDRSLIIVSNHQSLFDIIAISWFMRKHHPKFISKIELGKNIPSVSFNLNHGGSVLIDRKNPRQSLPALTKFGKYIAQSGHSAVIFPEGTRSKTGKLKSFNSTGLKILIKTAPDALVVPVVVNNSWKLLKYGNFPINSGIKLTLKVLEPIETKDLSPDELLQKVESNIAKEIII